MAEPATYHLHPLAEAEIVEQKAMLARAHRAGLLTPKQASDQLGAFIARLMSQAVVANEGTRMLRVTCPACSREHLIPSDVVDYRCKCDVSVERKTYIEQSAPDGSSVDPLTFDMLRDRPVHPF